MNTSASPFTTPAAAPFPSPLIVNPFSKATDTADSTDVTVDWDGPNPTADEG